MGMIYVSKKEEELIEVALRLRKESYEECVQYAKDNGSKPAPFEVKAAKDYAKLHNKLFGTGK